MSEGDVEHSGGDLNQYVNLLTVSPHTPAPSAAVLPAHLAVHPFIPIIDHRPLLLVTVMPADPL